MEVTYGQYFQNSVQSTVELARAFEHALGRDRTFEIIKKWTEKSAAESVKNQMSKKPIKNFEDLKRLRKEQKKTPVWTHMLTLTHPEEIPTKFCYKVTECL